MAGHETHEGSTAHDDLQVMIADAEGPLTPEESAALGPEVQSEVDELLSCCCPEKTRHNIATAITYCLRGGIFFLDNMMYAIGVVCLITSDGGPFRFDSTSTGETEESVVCALSICSCAILSSANLVYASAFANLVYVSERIFIWAFKEETEAKRG
jgi:hypothetical protein